ncbi:conserved hypothetical protein [Aeromonas salmonicida]|nr:conserved hypothetical protein [Aeromonas salmonicida]
MGQADHHIKPGLDRVQCVCVAGNGLLGQRFRQVLTDLAEHLFQNARVGNHYVAGVFVVVTTDEVGDDGTGLFGQQFTGCGIPRLEADLPEAVDATGGHIGQIQRGRTGTTDVGTFDEHALEHLQVGLDVMLLLEWETGGQNGTSQLFGLADTDAVAVQLSAVTTGRGKQLVTDGIVDDGLFCLALDAQGYGDGKVRNALDEVGRAIQWVNDPLVVRIGTGNLTRLFSNDAVFRVRFFDGVNDGRFGVTVNVGHEVIAAFLDGLDVFGLGKGFYYYLTGVARSAHGDIQHRMHRFTTGC